MEESKNITFQKERTNTDLNLEIESDKTNISVAQAKRMAVKQTKRSVQDSRILTDKNIANVRDKADRVRSDQMKNGGGEQHRIEQAQLLADEAVRLEGSYKDVAIDREHEVVNFLEASLLDQERQETDKSLAEERMITDDLVLSNSEKLYREVMEHGKTKAALTTRDEFLAIVSHDLRNPIGVISSCMEMLLEETVERKLDKETRSWLELAKRNADASLRLIGDVLDMERIAEGKFELVFAPYDIGRLIKEVMENFVQLASAKNILLRSAPMSMVELIECDRDRLAQVLSNLIGNAIKFTPEGGKVVLNIDESSEDDLTISICDNGIGIPYEKREQVFDRFAQLGSKDRRGLGLGLYISKMFVEAHGGKLWVESEVGVGSIFFIQIPRRAERGHKFLLN